MWVTFFQSTSSGVLRGACLTAIITTFLLFPATVRSETIRLALLHGDAEVFDYEVGVLRLALQHAPGNHVLELVSMKDVPQERVFRLLEDGTDRFDVFFSGFSMDREMRFRQIDIPISRGLLGHRVLVMQTTAEDVDQLPCDLKDLKETVSIGSGRGWPDTTILNAAGFEVVQSDYQGLWRMLDRGRYSAFNRGLHEAFIEVEQQARLGRSFLVERNLILVYRFDYFFYVAKQNKALAQILEDGLNAAYESGAFMEYFNSHPAIRAAIDQANPAQRCRIELENPLLSDRAARIPDKYWHRF